MSCLIKYSVPGLILTLISILCCGCRTTRKMETVRTDTLIQVVHHVDSIVIEKTELVHDSIVIRDSIVIVKNDQGSVVWGERWHSEESTKESNKERSEVKETGNDSIVIERHDDDKHEVIEKDDGLRLNFRVGIMLGLILALLGVYGFGKLFK